MKIIKLDHVNVRTQQLNVMIDWYTDVLGMVNGDRPKDSSSDGAWMYAGDQAVVHLVKVNEDPGAGADVPLKLEHFALSASGCESFENYLQANDIKYRRSDKKEINLIQINVWDPDGNHIHIDFSSDE